MPLMLIALSQIINRAGRDPVDVDFLEAHHCRSSVVTDFQILPDGKVQMIDSTSVRVHQQAAAQKNRLETLVSVEAAED